MEPVYRTMESSHLNIFSSLHTPLQHRLHPSVQHLSPGPSPSHPQSWSIRHSIQSITKVQKYLTQETNQADIIQKVGKHTTIRREEGRRYAMLRYS